MQQRILGRRNALVSFAGSLLVVGTMREALACAPRPQASGSGSTTPPSPPPLPPPTPGRVCAETHDNIEGPYYRQRAPERWDLTEPGMPGTPLELEGRIT